MSVQGIVIRPLGQPGDLGWVVMAHGEVYAAEFGWDAALEAFVARIAADYAASHDPAREAAWIAEADGRRAGCVFCVAADETTAQLRTLLVDPSARGHHLGGRLVDESVAFARQAGYARMKLWTNHPLAAARRVYLSRGFALVAEEPHHSFGADLIGQIYELDLRSDSPRDQAARVRPGDPDDPSPARQAADREGARVGTEAAWHSAMAEHGSREEHP